MSFPVVIDAARAAPEPAGKYGPYFANGAIYEINLTLSGPTGFPAPYYTAAVMQKSGSGASWAHVDLVHSPVPLASASTAMCAAQSPDGKIWLLYTANATGELTAQPFDPTTDTWGTAVGNASGGFTPIVACYRTSDNSLAVLGQGNTATTFGLSHKIVSVWLYDIGGAAWAGSSFDLGYSDYADATLWDLVPCGIVERSDGKLSAFFQQVTSPSSPDPKFISILGAGTGSTTIPPDCVLLDKLEIWGAGAHGADGGDGGGGGGAGYTIQTAVTVTPNSSQPYAVGAGGATNSAPGGNSSILGYTAGGGGSPSGIAGGAGGAGTFGGGAGGNGFAGGGGGGGGRGATASGPGTAGGNGNNITGGSPNGGNAIPPTSGGPGSLAGDGGGGNGLAVGGTGGAGANGAIVASYTPFTNNHNGRLFHQAVHTDNSLATLQNISQGDFPFDNVIPFAFDVAEGAGFVAVAFSGVNATANDNIMTGRAADADTLTFSWQTVSAANSGSELDPCPAIAAANANTYLAFLSATDLATVVFRLAVDSGGGFGPAAAIGSFDDPGCRIQINFGAGRLGYTFTTPTKLTLDYIPPA